MRKADIITTRICNWNEAKHKIAQWRVTGKTVSFTNGVFDILHRGHIFSLSQAAVEADYLIVGLNSDASTKRLKGNSRPVNDEQSRALVLASLLMVDMVVIFEEDTPLNLITTLQPDVLVKGGDYTLEQIVGAKEVMEAGGKVIINPIVEGFSTTGIIQKISS
ncbi:MULTISPECIES: D-glycero-beta-D-manno-heptose 1-phosphate adenylyltransferase [Niastella]|uniref:D-glycero-beta-D-manno-heptose 1-phosphate adenylyltransferase n=1 Tax=Niastella soli TaxID=2821487 RepID=A0ABS3YXS3_9BACT|nr:D-glycero-beta-D-manno-heptose 1-phosphate adenylyltransferase [Niastella soli]MBO9202317.1 D-glycero-beta-D-manno-heptose 1-phosphate adenylyltransferase [Niastella soli]